VPLGQMPTTLQPPEEAVPPPSEVVAVADPSTPGHINIQEEGVTSQPAGEPFASVGTVVGVFPPPAPLLMPYCSDEEGSGPTKMPYAEEEECEPPQTRSPKVEEAWELLRQAAREAASEGKEEDEDVGVEDQCPEPGHQDHTPVCPYTGRSYPQYRMCPAAPEPAEEKKPDNNTQKKEMQQSESRKMAPPEVDDEKLAGDAEEQEWPVFRLDTMEFRPSDAGFQPIHPRPF